MKLFKLFVGCLLVLLLASCGVQTSSSSNVPSNNVGGSDTDDNMDLIDPNPIVDANNTTDTNSSTGDSGDGDPVDNGSDDLKENSSFDTDGAIYDANACNGNTYRTASDASYNGVNLGENGSDFVNVKGEGLNFRSEHLEASSSKLSKTWVTLFYKSFPSAENLGLQGVTSHYMEGVFYLTYDIAWSDESIAGIDNILYIQSQKTTKPSCYRLTLNSIVGTNIDVQKVYR